MNFWVVIFKVHRFPFFFWQLSHWLQEICFLNQKKGRGISGHRHQLSSRNGRQAHLKRQWHPQAIWQAWKRWMANDWHLQDFYYRAWIQFGHWDKWGWCCRHSLPQGIGSCRRFASPLSAPNGAIDTLLWNWHKSRRKGMFISWLPFLNIVPSSGSCRSDDINGQHNSSKLTATGNNQVYFCGLETGM